MLEEYKELCRTTADAISDWTSMTKNELCRAYVSAKDNKYLQNAYFSAILYKYWHLIGKYYYMSANCATPEECYGWLIDSVSCCVNMASWEDPKSSIYGDPHGPDKVINRCMKCARLTYYQFINRKKRKDDFGLLSIDELKELYGTDMTDVDDYEQEMDVSLIVIKEYVVKMFEQKDYFVAFMIDCILSSNVFDVKHDTKHGINSEFNIRKLCTELKKINSEYLSLFAKNYNLDVNDVERAFEYVNAVPSSVMKKKVTQALNTLKHSSFIKTLRGASYVD